MWCGRESTVSAKLERGGPRPGMWAEGTDVTSWPALAGMMYGSRSGNTNFVLQPFREFFSRPGYWACRSYGY